MVTCVLILNNVKIYQPNGDFDKEEIYHLHIENGYFSSIHKGISNEEGNHVIDGKGRTVVPGFTDSHMHLLRFGMLKNELDLTQVTSWTEMKKEVEAYYPEIEEADWIFGKGFNDGAFTDIDHLLTAEDLDEINVNKYMYFMHQDGHECVISKKLLKRLEEEEDFHKEPEVFKERDDQGNLTGRFKDTAVHYINHHLWERSIEHAKESLSVALPYLLENGITTVHSDDRSFVGSYQSLWKTYTSLEEDGKLPIEAYLHHYIFDQKDLDEFIENFHKRTGEGTDRVKVGAIKIFLDGTQRLHTAAMRQPYPDSPDTTGYLIYDQDQLNKMIQTAASHGMQVAVHALGDRAVQSAITAFEQPEARTKKLRHRIIHAQTLAEDLLERMEDLGVYIETQPSFLMDEWNQKDQWTPKDILPYCDAFGSMINHNIPITLSSDAPIGALDPIVSIFGAVNRMDENYQPSGGWMPSEKITLDQAFSGFGTIPSELEWNEGVKGRVSEGYQADFVLLNHHPNDISTEDILQLHVQSTWIKGEKVYSKTTDGQ